MLSIQTKVVAFSFKRLRLNYRVLDLEYIYKDHTAGVIQMKKAIDFIRSPTCSEHHFD